jgi:hypothetical protein
MNRSSCFVIFVLDTGNVDVDNNGGSDNNGLTCSAILQALFETWAFAVEFKNALGCLWEFNLLGHNAFASVLNFGKNDAFQRVLGSVVSKVTKCSLETKVYFLVGASNLLQPLC